MNLERAIQKVESAIDSVITPAHIYIDPVLEAARLYANIHPSRLHKWHILHIKAGSWGLTHPLDCDLTNCAYQDQAETWREQPDELGNYRWEGDPVEDDWDWLTPGDTDGS